MGLRRCGLRTRLAAGIAVLACLALARWAIAVHEEAPRGARTLVSSDPVVSPSPAKSAAQRANVLIIVLDAARADHCGCYGYRRETTPNIDRLAGDSVLFEQHFTTFPYTLQSTASLMTGLYPDTHLAARGSPMPDSAFTLARGLSNAGLATAFFSSNIVASSENLDKDFAQRATTWVLARRWRHAGRNAGASWRDPASLLDAFGTWLRARERGRFFAYLHFLPPHVPYNAPEAMAAPFASRPAPRAGQRDLSLSQAGRGPSPPAAPKYGQWVRLYDANLRWGDWAVGQVYKALRDSGRLESTLLIITSDHGEAFGEHGYEYHGGSVYDEVVRVPLILRFPNQQHRGLRVSALTQSVDILPTVLDYLRIGYPRDAVQGRSLMPLVSRSESSVHDYVFATCLGYPSYLVRDRDYALILHRGEGTRELYDLRADPGQRRNIIAERPEVEDQMLAVFRQFALSQKRPPLEFLDAKGHVRAGPPPGAGALTPETRMELEALGYVQ